MGLSNKLVHASRSPGGRAPPTHSEGIWSERARGWDCGGGTHFLLLAVSILPIKWHPRLGFVPPSLCAGCLGPSPPTWMNSDLPSGQRKDLELLRLGGRCGLAQVREDCPTLGLELPGRKDLL